MRLLDILIATVILFPWVTEDVALDVPGLRIADLSDLGIPLLAAAVVAEAVRWSRTNWRRGALVLQRFPGRSLAIAAAVLGCGFLSFALLRHLSLEQPRLDLSYAIWSATRGTGGVLMVALVAPALRSWSGEPWERSFFLRNALALGRAWTQAVQRTPARTLWTAAGALGAAYLWVALVRHWAFESHGYDLGIFTNVLWNLTQGNGYVSSVKGGINLFADHQSPLFWALAPMFWLAPRPETLLFAQAFGLAAGGPALFYLTREKFGREHWAPAALPWLYWSYLPLRNANAFDFHPEVFMLPLFLWAFAAFAMPGRRVKWLGVAALVAALGAKESAAVVATGLGIAWALSAQGGWRARWPGLVLAAAGVALFLFNLKVVPRMLGAEYAYMSHYSRFGGGVSDVLLAPFTQTAYFLSELIDRERLVFLFWTLAPLGFLPLFHWRAALAAVPPYLMLFLTEGDQRVRLVFHYGIEPGTALFWALPMGLAVFAQRFGWQRAGVWMLAWAIACHGSTELTRARSFYQYVHAGWLGAEVIPCLDPQLPMAASDSLVPHLATRAWISYPEHLRQAPSEEPVRCVVTDLDLSNWPLGREGTRSMLSGLREQGYREAWRCHGLRVHALANSDCMRCVPRCP